MGSVRWIFAVAVSLAFIACGRAQQAFAPDGGWMPPDCQEARPECLDVQGTWSVAVSQAPHWDAGGFSWFLPLPPLSCVASFVVDSGSTCSTAKPLVDRAHDAGCVVRVTYGLATSNPSETCWHAVDLALQVVDGGTLTGSGTDTLTGGSNCNVPLVASATPL